MFNTDKRRESPIPIAAQKTDSIIGIDQVDGLCADIKNAEDARLDAELPFTSEKCLIPVYGKRLTEVGAEDAGQIQPARELTIASAEFRPTGIRIERSKQ